MKQSCGLFLVVKHLLHLSLTRQRRSTESSPALIDGQAEWKRCQGANGGKDKELKRDGGVGGGCLPGVDILGGLTDKEQEEEEKVEEDEVQGFQTQTSSRSSARLAGQSFSTTTGKQKIQTAGAAANTTAIL